MYKLSLYLRSEWYVRGSWVALVGVLVWWIECPRCFLTNQEAEAALLRRLDALERLVFGRSAPSEVDVQPLMPKVEAIAKAVTRAEGGRRELEELAAQGAALQYVDGRST